MYVYEYCRITATTTTNGKNIKYKIDKNIQNSY